MSSLRVIRDSYVDTNIIQKSLVLPLISSTNLPPNLFDGIGGGLSYDVVTRRVYYNDGSMWKPLATAGPAGSQVNSYSHIKNGDQSIPPNSNVTISFWNATPSPPFSTLTEWNLTTGIYTATEFQDFSLDADISWSAGVSNLGKRILRIMYFDFNTSTTLIANEVVTQADANTNVETTQAISIYLKLNPSDKVWLEVRHDAPLTLSLAGGNHTSVSGARILTL